MLAQVLATLTARFYSYRLTPAIGVCFHHSKVWTSKCGMCPIDQAEAEVGQRWRWFHVISRIISGVGHRIAGHFKVSRVLVDHAITSITAQT